MYVVSSASLASVPLYVYTHVHITSEINNSIEDIFGMDFLDVVFH